MQKWDYVKLEVEGCRIMVCPFSAANAKFLTTLSFDVAPTPGRNGSAEADIKECSKEGIYAAWNKALLALQMDGWEPFQAKSGGNWETMHFKRPHEAPHPSEK